MNDRTDQFTDTPRLRLSSMESQLEGVRSDINANMSNDKKDLESKLKAAGLLVHKIKEERNVESNENPKVLKVHEKLGTAVAQGWKTEVKKAKLDDHAARADNNAEAGISIAEAKVADAVLATYQAIEAVSPPSKAVETKDTEWRPEKRL